MHHGLGIRSWTDADVVTLDGADEGFCHSVALRTFDRRRSRFKADVASEAASIAGDIATAVVGEPFDGDRQTIDPAEPMLDGSHHQVPHIITADAACSGQEAHGFPITAVQGKGDPHLLTVVAANLEAIGVTCPRIFGPSIS